MTIVGSPPGRALRAEVRAYADLLGTSDYQIDEERVGGMYTVAVWINEEPFGDGSARDLPTAEQRALHAFWKIRNARTGPNRAPGPARLRLVKEEG